MSKSLQKIKLQRSAKKEKLVELEKGFVSSFKANNCLSQYNALNDKNAYHYFLNRPVKKHLKRLAKAINLEPLTTQNQKIIHSLNEMIETYNTHNLSERKLKETLTDPANNDEKKPQPTDQSSRQRLSTFNLYDPYTESLKPTSIEKIKRCKLQKLKQKKRTIINQSFEKCIDKSRYSGKQSVFKATDEKTSSKRQNWSLNKSKHPNYLEKIEIQNQSKHLKLVDFIKKKKSELSSIQVQRHEPLAQMIQA